MNQELYKYLDNILYYKLVCELCKNQMNPQICNKCSIHIWDGTNYRDLDKDKVKKIVEDIENCFSIQEIEKYIDKLFNYNVFCNTCKYCEKLNICRKERCLLYYHLDELKWQISENKKTEIINMIRGILYGI